MHKNTVCLMFVRTEKSMESEMWLLVRLFFSWFIYWWRWKWGFYLVFFLVYCSLIRFEGFLTTISQSSVLCRRQFVKDVWYMGSSCIYISLKGLCDRLMTQLPLIVFINFLIFGPYLAFVTGTHNRRVKPSLNHWTYNMLLISYCMYWYLA